MGVLGVTFFCFSYEISSWMNRSLLNEALLNPPADDSQHPSSAFKKKSRKGRFRSFDLVLYQSIGRLNTKPISSYFIFFKGTCTELLTESLIVSKKTSFDLH